jgi:hypothetical protein
MTVTFAGGTGTTAYELVWDPAVDRRGGVCEPFKKPPSKRLNSLKDVNEHFAQISREVNRMTGRINAYREGWTEYGWDELKSMNDCLGGQINLLAAAAERFKGKEAEGRREYIEVLRSIHRENVERLEKYRPR